MKQAATDRHFNDLAPQWWDETGPFRPLHRLNPVRIDHVLAQAGGGVRNKAVLDVGCGGGLLAEPLARLGAKVTAIDAAAVAIKTARAHAAGEGLEIDYRQAHTGDLVKAGKKFDVVTALEVIEHVEAPQRLVADVAKLLKAGGVAVFSTLNRTMKSLLLGKIAAEYLLGLVPPGTHDWRQFVKPHELDEWCRAAGLKPFDVTGLVFNPLGGDFVLKKGDCGINYFMAARKI